MSSNIIKADNGVTSGVTGIVQTAGSDGTLQLQTTTSGGSAIAVLTLNNSGTLVINQTGQGIQFTTGSAVLTDYEVGSWTPNQGSGLTVVGTFSSSGVYVKIGSLVTVQFKVSGSTSVAVGNLGIISSNLPYTVSSTVSAVGTITTLSVTSSAYANSTTTNVYNSGSAIAATSTIWVTVTYSV